MEEHQVIIEEEKGLGGKMMSFSPFPPNPLENSLTNGQ